MDRVDEFIEALTETATRDALRKRFYASRSLAELENCVQRGVVTTAQQTGDSVLITVSVESVHGEVSSWAANSWVETTLRMLHEKKSEIFRKIHADPNLSSKEKKIRVTEEVRKFGVPWIIKQSAPDLNSPISFWNTASTYLAGLIGLLAGIVMSLVGRFVVKRSTTTPVEDE